MQDLLKIALEYHEAGLRVIPFWKPGGETKFPKWEKYKTSQSEEEVRALFAKPAEGIALICADGIEAVDIDVKHDPQKRIDQDYFHFLIHQVAGGKEALKRCVIQKTKSGGYHIIYRAANAETNQKLATRRGQKEAIIETRGPGKGLLFIYPSPGYSVEQGDLKAIPEITPEERDNFIIAARLFDEREEASGGDGLRAGDDFNAQHDVLDVLEDYGWRKVGSDKSGDIVHLNRPGAKNPKGVDGSVLKTKSGTRVFHPFTTSTDFNVQKNYSAFGVYAVHEHNGNFTAAARALWAQGYGKENSEEKEEETAPAKLYGLEPETPETALLLVQNRGCAEAAKAAGLPGVVAIEGALTGGQIEAALRAGARSLSLALDNDQAGQKATREAVETLLRYQERTGRDFDVFVCQYPDGCKDLDGLLSSSGGADQAREMIREKIGPARYLVRWLDSVRAPEIEAAAGGMSNDTFRAELIRELVLLERLLRPVDVPQFRQYIEPLYKTWGIDGEAITAAADSVRELEAAKQYRQEAARISQDAAALFQEGKQEEAEAALLGISEARARSGAGKFARLFETHTEAALREHFQNAPPTLETSFRLDVNGHKKALKLPAGGLSFFAARPGHGKSRMLVNLALDVCKNHPGEVHYFTYEESAEKVTAKALNAFLGMDLTGRLYDTNEETIEAYFRGEEEAINPEKAGDFESGKAAFFSLVQDGRLNIHFSEMRAESLAEAIAYLHRQRNVSAVFVDYIQLLNLEKIGRGINNRQEEVKAICNILKDVARETGLPFIMAAQFNREVKNADSMDMAALREAGDLEQTAALVIGMWNRFKDVENPAAEIDARVLKNRGGAPDGRGIWQYSGNRYKVYPDAVVSGTGRGGNSTLTDKNKNPFHT